MSSHHCVIIIKIIWLLWPKIWRLHHSPSFPGKLFCLFHASLFALELFQWFCIWLWTMCTPNYDCKQHPLSKVAHSQLAYQSSPNLSYLIPKIIQFLVLHIDSFIFSTTCSLYSCTSQSKQTRKILLPCLNTPIVIYTTINKLERTLTFFILVAWILSLTDSAYSFFAVFPKTHHTSHSYTSLDL